MTFATSILEAIAHKRDGLELSDEEIANLIDAYARDAVPDYQMAAWAMAVYLRGMEARETATLTRCMLESGRVMQWRDDGRPVVDKHSTGGVGDKVSLVLAPLLACSEVRVPMVSGRGLGATGGTLDKLESIAGFRTDLSSSELQAIVDRVGCVICGAGDDIAPADKRLYALRDVTGTVASIPLITASIMSKKLAEGLDALALDVKWGSGAFMQSLDGAERLAQSLVSTGRRMGVVTTALLTDMNQPLGRMIGAAVEVDESVACLEGGGPDDLRQVTIALGAELLVSAGAAADVRQASERLERLLASGAARERLAQMVAAQGGDLDARRAAAPAGEVTARRDGYVSQIDAQKLGWAVIELGGGRRRKEDAIDHRVGLEMCVRLGDRVARGQPLLRIFADPPRRAAVAERLAEAVSLDNTAPAPFPLIRTPRSS